jgi:hypothetical protein
MAPIPPSSLFVPVYAVTIRAYVLVDLAYAMIGSEHHIAFRIWNASSALPVIGLFTYSESFHIALFKDSKILAKSLM